MTSNTKLGCRWCGHPENGHGKRHALPAGLHTYVHPTEQQMRSRARRESESEGT